MNYVECVYMYLCKYEWPAESKNKMIKFGGQRITSVITKAPTVRFEAPFSPTSTLATIIDTTFYDIDDVWEHM